MNEPNTPESRYDVIVIGAGLCGLIFLKYARERGLRCLALEKAEDVGGVWRWLPSWQDIQNRRADFALNDVPLCGVEQPDIHAYARAWVRKFDLGPSIELGREVVSVARAGDGWTVRTRERRWRTDHLVVASGVQNEPWTPDVERQDAQIRELHSARLRRPETLAGRRVTVVGGGASSWDLLELAIEHGAEEIHWVYRSVRWLLPTGRAKHEAWPNLRELAVIQALAPSSRGVNAFLRLLLKIQYRRHGLEELEPDEPFDIREHQLIPGRTVMCRSLDRISRHRSEVRRLSGREVTLQNGDRFRTDLLLWATGYRMDLAYLGLPEYRDIRTLDQLSPRLGSLVRSRDYTGLFFLGMTLIESTSTTPFFAAVEAKAIAAHIAGEGEIPTPNVPRIIAHWDLLQHFARFDGSPWRRFRSRVVNALKALWYLVFRDRSLNV